MLLSTFTFWLIWYLEWELIPRNNPFLNTHGSVQDLVNQSASLRLLQLSVFSSSLQPHLTAFNIVLFCSTVSCRLCFTKITWASGNTAYNLLIHESSTYQVTIPDSQTGQTPQARGGGVGSQQTHNTPFHKGSFTSVAHALWIHCSPVLRYQCLSPLTMSSEEFTSTSWSQPLPSATGFWCCMSQTRKVAQVAIKWSISHHKPILQKNIVVPGIISYWKRPHFLRHLPNSTEVFYPKPSLFHSNFSSFVWLLFCLSLCRSGFAVRVMQN